MNFRIMGYIKFIKEKHVCLNKIKNILSSLKRFSEEAAGDLFLCNDCQKKYAYLNSYYKFGSRNKSTEIQTKYVKYMLTNINR